MAPGCGVGGSWSTSTPAWRTSRRSRRRAGLCRGWGTRPARNPNSPPSASSWRRQPLPNLTRGSVYWGHRESGESAGAPRARGGATPNPVKHVEEAEEEPTPPQCQPHTCTSLTRLHQLHTSLGAFEGQCLHYRCEHACVCAGPSTAASHAPLERCFASLPHSPRAGQWVPTRTCTPHLSASAALTDQGPPGGLQPSRNLPKPWCPPQGLASGLLQGGPSPRAPPLPTGGEGHSTDRPLGHSSEL